MSGTNRILVVEDDQDILTLVLKHMRANDFIPNGFSDPLSALEEFKSDPHRYAAILSDVRMQGMSGIELAREIHKINPDTKIVLMTAYEIVNEDLAGLPVVDIDEIIKKPFKLTDICTRMKKYVHAR
jgi:DNA-binding NtrC family response regulator